MNIKKFISIPVILLLFFIQAKAQAANNPYYTIEGTYSEAAKTYTVDVYLTTDYYLAAGTFGMELDSNIPVEWKTKTDTQNAGYMQINTENFQIIETKPFEENEAVFKDNHYIVVQWSLNEADISSPIRDRQKLGSFTIENVTLDSNGKIQGWSDEPFRLLDWRETNLAKTPLFTQSDDDYKSLNDEIWRTATDAERTAGAPIGYYQGFVFNTDGTNEQVDIGFEYISSVDVNMTITGRVEGYNPNYDVKITAYKDNRLTEAYEGKITSRIIRADGWTTYDYKIEIPKLGNYIIAYEKQQHLTYVTTVTAEEKATAANAIAMICGDIDGDGHIQYPDRASLIRFLNHQKPWDIYAEQFEKSDLNGDGCVNLFDLNILKANLNKTY